MKTIEVVFEHGHLTPLQPLPFAEHQHVWVTIVPQEPTMQQLAHLASQSPSFAFLQDPAEDLYSMDDGEPA